VVILYDLGDPVWLAFQATGVNGNLVVPGGAVTATITQPDGTSVSSSVTNPSVGQYETVFVPSQPGRHSVRWVAAGTSPSTYADVFDVSDASPPYIVGLDDAKTLLRFDDTDSDAELRRYNAAATFMVEQYLDQVVIRRVITGEEHYYSSYRHRVGRVLVTPSTRAFHATTDAIFVNKRPVLSLTGVATIDGLYTWDVNGLHVDKSTGALSPLPGFPSLWGDLTIDYVAGYQVIPANIQEAARIMIQHLWATRRGLAGNLVTQQLPGFNIGFAIPQSVKDLLGPQPPVFA
jgi:hypothetical protein